jgi:hypothetical protein
MRLGRHMMRRMVAGLLALALLVVPGPPMRDAAAALSEVGAAHHCATDEAPAQADHGAMAHHPPAAHDPGQTPDRDPADMACCPAAQCPAAVAVPPAVLPSPPMPAVSAGGFTVDHQLRGIPVDPALRPPRRVA